MKKKEGERDGDGEGSENVRYHELSWKSGVFLVCVCVHLFVCFICVSSSEIVN